MAFPERSSSEKTTFPSRGWEAASALVVFLLSLPLRDPAITGALTAGYIGGMEGLRWLSHKIDR